jgi:hypothetical protein
MDISYHTLKSAIYGALALFGICLIAIAWSLIRTARYSSDPLLNTAPAVILLLVGMTCVFFAAEIIFLRDDPDIWQ